MDKKIYFFLLVISVIFLSLYVYFKNRTGKGIEKELSESFPQIEEIVTRGDSLWSILTEAGVKPGEAQRALKSLSKIYDIRKRKVRPGEKYRITFSTSGKLLEFEYMKTPLLSYKVIKSSYGYISKEIKKHLKKYICGRKGILKRNLYTSMLKSDVDPELILDFTEIFAWQIDFLTEPRNGDKFYIVWERYENEGMIRDGRILIAKYVTRRGKEFTAIGFGDEKSGWEFYSPNGKSMRKQFLKAPLHYRRISSYFSLRRFHPVLKIWRPHRGIDYAAPYGTPVSAVGDGVVVYAGWKGAAGKCVIIKHNSIYKTSYGHLSRIARGIRKGVKVKQKQVIGYVGATGLATGPHLDFRLRKYGKFVNFLRLKFPPARRIPRKKMKKFEIYKKRAYYFLGKLMSGENFKVSYEKEKNSLFN